MSQDNKLLNSTEDDIQEALDARNAAAEASAEQANMMQTELEANVAAAKEALRTSKKGFKIFIIIMAVLIVLIIVQSIHIMLTNAPIVSEDTPLTNVAVQTVQRGPIKVTAPISGRIETENTYNVTPSVSGEVTSVNISAGTFVTAGQVLFTINSTQAQLSYNSAQLQYQNAQNSYSTAEAAYKSSRVGVTQAESSLSQAKEAFDRMQKLYNAGTISKNELEQSENAVKNANSALEQANASAAQAQTGINTAQTGISSAQVGVDQAADTLKNYTVTAPASGYVSVVNVKVGDLASQSQAAVVISDTSVLELKADISEYLISSIRTGENVEVYVSSVSDTPFNGVVTNISQVPAAETLTYPVKIRINDTMAKLKAGMFAEIRLVSENRENAVIVPSEAVVLKDGKNCVFLLDSDKVKQTEVNVGIDNGTIAEITKGLKGGETIVVKGQNYVNNGDKVNIVSQNGSKKEK